MKVTLVNWTLNAERMLVLAKQTRLLNTSALDRLGEILAMSKEEIQKELEQAFATISSAWEFVQYIFFLEGVSRAFTHQLVRHRVGFSFAQQSMRTVAVEDFDYYFPEDILFDQSAFEEVVEVLEHIKQAYSRLLKMSIEPEDARGILPTNILTNILVSCNLRSLSTLLEIRLCYRVQGEFRNVARDMRKEVLKAHPRFEQVLRPFCLRYWRCRFPTKAQRCPIFNDPEFSTHLVGKGGVPDKDKEKYLVEKWTNLIETEEK